MTALLMLLSAANAAGLTYWIPRFHAKRKKLQDARMREMLASELVAEIQALMKRYGDVPVQMTAPEGRRTPVVGFGPTYSAPYTFLDGSRHYARIRLGLVLH